MGWSTAAHGNVPVNSDFRPAWWCRNAHLQTLWPYFRRPLPQPRYERERLELPDGDFLDLDWVTSLREGPLTIVLHGLAGCSRSHYVRGVVTALANVGIRSVVMHHRGCSGQPNRLARSYHAGETGDIATLVNIVRDRYPDTPLAVVGYSLGGNILLKWLGENRSPPVTAAVAVSVPFLLDQGVARMERGSSRLYQWHLVRHLKSAAREKFSRREPSPIDLKELETLRTFRAFDDRITGPLHGFESGAEYYRRCSSRQYLAAIDVPVLILQALDDPMTAAMAIPTRDELSPTIHLELSARGGHVGFVSGRWPWRARFWLEDRISEYLGSMLNPTGSRHD